MPADISIPDVAVGFFVELRFSELLRPRLHGQDDHRFPGLRVDNGGICVLHKIQLFGLFGEAVNVSVFKFQQLAIVIIRDLVILSPLQGDDILFREKSAASISRLKSVVKYAVCIVYRLHSARFVSVFGSSKNFPFPLLWREILWYTFP